MHRNTIKRSGVSLVLVTVFLATLASSAPPAPPAKKSSAARAPRARTAVNYTLYKYIRMYKPTDDQKAKLEKVLLVQKKDLADHDKIYAPKIKTVDDNIAVLQKEIDALKAEKSAFSAKRAELLLDHKAELNNVFTREQRIASLTAYLRSTLVYRYWGGLSETQQKDLTTKFEAAALAVVQAKPEESEGVMSAQRRELQKVVSEIITPQVRRAGETKYMTDSTIRAFYRVKLTDDQKAQIQALCDKNAKQKSELYAQYRQLDKDRDAIRKAMYKFGTSDSIRKMRTEVTENILTEEQRKALTSSS
jgi:hypothetical protein